MNRLCFNELFRDRVVGGQISQVIVRDGNRPVANSMEVRIGPMVVGTAAVTAVEDIQVYKNDLVRFRGRDMSHIELWHLLPGLGLDRTDFLDFIEVGAFAGKVVTFELDLHPVALNCLMC